LNFAISQRLEDKKVECQIIKEKQATLQTAFANQVMSQAKRQEEENQRKELRSWFAVDAERAAIEAKSIEKERAKRKVVDGKGMRECLNGAVQEKRDRDHKRREDDAILDVFNSQIMQIKERIASKRKDMENSIVK
jgi:hypothetical protein